MSQSTRTPPPASGGDNAELTRTLAVRPQAVAHARELIDDPDYPTEETIKKISTLLARRAHPDSSSNSSNR